MHATETHGPILAYSLQVLVHDVAHWPPYYNKLCETRERPTNIKPWFWIFDVRFNGFDSWASNSGNPIAGRGDVDVDINNAQCDVYVYASIPKKLRGHSLDEFFLQITNTANHPLQTVKVDEILSESADLKVRMTTHNIEWDYAPARPFIKRLVAKLGKEAYQNYISRHVLGRLAAKGFDTHRHLVYQLSLTDPSTHFPLVLESIEIEVIGCPYRRFGAKCDKECMCMNGATCHGWNGACKCAAGWQGPACDIPITPYVSLYVDSGRGTVPLHGVIRLRCIFTGIRREIVKWEHNGDDLLADVSKNVRIITSTMSSTHVMTLSKATYGDSGNYRCMGAGYDKERNFTSNFVKISIKGCPVNTWGKNCTKNCNCVHASTCTHSTGCQCLMGWTGEICNRDTEKPSIHGCPSDITKLLSSSSDMVNVAWPPVTATDNDGIANMTSTHDSGQLFPVGNSKVVISVFDNWNNSNVCTFSVNVKAASDHWNGKTGRLIIGIIAATCSVFVAVGIVTIIRLRVRRLRPQWNGYCRLDYTFAQRKRTISPGVPTFHRKQLVILHLLGEGAFSKVHKARLALSKDKVKIVAVKILKDDIEHWQTFVQEIQLLQKLQGHSNVVTFMGVILEQSHCCTVTELMKQDLLDYLKTWPKESKVTEQFDSSLVTFALHVARALEYLDHQQVVHRDIAARNVLISFNDVAKIADFGLSRDVYQKGQYQRHTTGGLLVPVRWMAPEALANGVHSSKSDIWSYGVLLWEMVTLGCTPYPEFQPLESASLARQLSMGYRLSRPQRCTEDIYGMMRHCWRNNPDERPTATGLVNNIVRLQKCNKGMFIYGRQ
ncbi:uncharacterized protein [Ptychodera flava]|uniref:uncharacterized protein isoform X2 n=1 Tax=Ptychodera flava TaxID=63121 RepID=UPI003969C6E6